MDVQTFDPGRVTYTDDQGNEHGALDYLLTDRLTGESTAHLACFSRYGATSADCAPVAVALTVIVGAQTGDPLTAQELDGAMSSVVNEQADVAHLLVDYGPCEGIDPFALLDDDVIADALHALADEWSGVDSRAVLDAYVDCALWSSHDDGRPLDADHDRDDVALPGWRAMRRDVCAFLRGARPSDLEVWAREFDDAQIGHDLWLTRNRHGAGFWDRFTSTSKGDYAAGLRLTADARALGEVDLYVGDDGRVWQAGDETYGEATTDAA